MRRTVLEHASAVPAARALAAVRAPRMRRRIAAIDASETQKRRLPMKKARFTYENSFSRRNARSTIRTAR
jgi:hypothetical protein